MRDALFALAALIVIFGGMTMIVVGLIAIFSTAPSASDNDENEMTK